MSLAARAGARQVECRPSHRDTSASFGVPLFRRQRRDECKYEGQPVSLHPLDDNFFIHREYTTPPSSGSPPASKHSTIGAAKSGLADRQRLMAVTVCRRRGRADLHRRASMGQSPCVTRRQHRPRKSFGTPLSNATSGTRIASSLP